jgi:hypothetical protein
MRGGDDTAEGIENEPPGSAVADRQVPPPRPARIHKQTARGLTAAARLLSGGELLAFRGASDDGAMRNKSDAVDSPSPRRGAGSISGTERVQPPSSARGGSVAALAGSPQSPPAWARPASARSSDIDSLLTRQGASQMVQLDLSSCSLSSMSHYRAAIASLRKLRHIDLSQNLITSLRPIRALPSLETINCSNNNLKVLDGLEECPQLSSIIAADNQIATIGDLRSLSRLRTLGLRGNTLCSIAALPHHLPAGLHSLDVANNELGNLHDLRYVSSLMELRRLDLRANPLTSMSHMQNINYRPFVVFLLPRISLLDSTAITRQEWTASRSLFSVSLSNAQSPFPLLFLVAGGVQSCADMHDSFAFFARCKFMVSGQHASGFLCVPLCVCVTL